MQTIYKYPLEVTDAQRIAMPEGAKILTVQMGVVSLTNPETKISAARAPGT